MKHLGRLFFAFLVLVVVALWWQTPWIVKALEGTGKAPVELGTFGDIYGTTNALFSGLAFLGLIYTIYLQRLDLKQNMEELKLSRLEVAATNDALKEQTRQMQIAAQLSAIPIMISHYKTRLYTLAPLAFHKADEIGFSPSDIDGRIDYLNSAPFLDLTKQLLDVPIHNRTSKDELAARQLGKKRDEIIQTLQVLKQHVLDLESIYRLIRDHGNTPPC